MTFSWMASTTLAAVSRSGRLLFLVWLSLVWLASSQGITPETWRVSSYTEFAEGEAQRVAIEHPGNILLSPSYSVFSKIHDPAVWSLAESADGTTLYAGTGNSAKIYKLAADTKAATAEAKLFADLEGNAVYALLGGKGGELFAGVSPGGNVYKINADGAVTLIGSSEQDYIWAMVQDATGDLVLATGDKGQIVKMGMDGKKKTLAKTGEKHILSLIADPSGKIYFGTAPSGWVGVLENEKKFRVLYDSELAETKALALDGEGNLYAAVVPTIQVEPKRDAPQPGPAGAASKVDKSSELVRITPAGVVRVLGKTPNAAVNQLFAGGTGVLVGSGDEGKLFQLGPRQEIDLVADFESNDILTIVKRQSGGVWIGTGNSATVIVLPLGTNKGGTYSSKALDAQVSTQWGRMTWKAGIPEGATLAFQTRSGNTKEPDKNWTDWSAPLAQPGLVTSPPGRFLQWRAKFGGTAEGRSATVHEVEVVYQGFNQPPHIDSVQVGDGSPAASESSASASSSKSTTPASKPASAKASSESASTSNPTSLSLSWQATDPNSDTLIYDLHYRRVGETLWKEIEKDLKAAKYTWNVGSLPDGDYEVRVIASDRLANPPAAAAMDRWRTEPIRIDKTAPEIVDWKNAAPGAGTFSVNVTAKDATSRVVSAEAVLDGDEDHLVPLLPEDGILDSNEESFKITLEGLASGEHSVAVRAKDEKGNTGSESLVFTIP
jgi:hypothetical protein